MLEGKVAVITGSTSGIGLNIAIKLAEAGASIMLNGFGDPVEITQLCTSLEQTYKVQVKYFGIDLAQATGPQTLLTYTQQTLGRIDILVNNAGIQYVAPIESFPADKWETILALNLSAAFYGIQAALPLMKEQKWGRIINIASAHGLVASAFKSAYVAAKHGLLGLTKTVALETASENITCNAICPGWVLTPLVERQIQERAQQQGITYEQASRDLLSEKQPSQRFVSPEEIGDLAVFLCGPGGNSMTGAALSVDGGWTAQ
ncbi:3-hydroxybutyrate dehydrogenase [Candidatus Paracaedimonas acanthamoebae]|nr:3-hydroxybutyrate dehydrogenase [Candidatus Paracaedimonas acanthamoebae]